ncbi:MAG: tetratricopeptide repeat protein [Thermoflexales bacterium]|nr:tetratricopeptide repeat protein [Thermoflexales bacterium]
MAKKPKRRHIQPPPSRGPGLEEILSRARALQEEGKLKEAVQVLDEAPPHIQRRPELLVLRGLLLASIGDMDEALSTLEEAQRRDPDNLLTYYFLGMTYSELNMPAHALRALREVVEYQDMLPDEVAEDVQGLLDDLEESLSRLARSVGVSPERADEAEYQLELGYRASRTGDVQAALRYLRRAASVAPRWPVPRRMEMEILAMAGRFREAVEVGERLLAEYPDLSLVREILVRAHTAQGNRQAAEEVARFLREQPYHSAVELGWAIRALGYLNDDKGIYRLYRRHRDLVDEIADPSILITLGSAAANLGHFQTARWLWDQATAQGAAWQYLNPFFAAANRKAPGPGIADRYPTSQFSQFAPHQANQELQELLLSWLNHQIESKPFQKRLRALIDRHPVFLQQMIQLFRESDARYIPAEILTLVGTPESLEELRRFVFGQRGPFAERMTVLQMLADVGGIDPDQLVEVWDEIRQEWRRLRVPRWNVVEPGESPYPPQTLTMVQECVDALKAGKTQRARELAEQALSLAPDNPDLYILSAVAWQASLAKSEEYLQKAVELDPRHVGARAWLAQLALNRGDLLEARRQLDILSDRQEFRPWEFAEYLYARALVSLEEGDPALARFYTDAGLRWNEEDERFLELEWRIDARTPGSRLYMERERSRQLQERRRTQPIRPDAPLKECLGRLSRESLVVMARVHSVQYANLRKELLIERLAEALTDPRTLEEAAADLSDGERQALQDVLDAGGILPWDEFTARYGSDVEESQYWYYRTPETLMGRLRMYGFLSDGTVEGQRVVLIPVELRGLLPRALAAARDTQTQTS